MCSDIPPGLHLPVQMNMSVLWIPGHFFQSHIGGSGVSWASQMHQKATGQQLTIVRVKTPVLPTGTYMWTPDSYLRLSWSTFRYLNRQRCSAQRSAQPSATSWDSEESHLAASSRSRRVHISPRTVQCAALWGCQWEHWIWIYCIKAYGFQNKLLFVIPTKGNNSTMLCKFILKF